MKGDDSILDIMPPRKKQNKGPNKVSMLTLFSSVPNSFIIFCLCEFGIEFLCSKYKISQDMSLLFQSSKAIGRSDKKL
ncbi:unnamed protein product [Brassica oleracea]